MYDEDAQLTTKRRGAYHPKEVFGHQEQRLGSTTGPGRRLTRQEKTPIVVTTATGVPAFPGRERGGNSRDWRLAIK
jgi:hypothetical protein